MPELSQGTTFQFNNIAYTVTRVTVNLQWSGSQRNKISTAHLGTEIEAEEPFVYGFKPRSVDSASQVEVEILGGALPTVGTTGTVNVAGSTTYAGTGTCLSSVATASVGELIKGTATFRVANPT